MQERIQKALRGDARFSAWQVTETRGKSTQRYQVFNDVEARRTVETRACDVRVHVAHPDGTLGESSFTVVNPEEALTPALDAAFARARLVKNRAWTLPDAPSTTPTSTASVDAHIVEQPHDAAEEVAATITNAVRASQNVELSASEVFCDHRVIHLVNSRGLDLTREETSAYTEYVLLAKAAGHDEIEAYQSKRARYLRDLALDAQVADDVRATQDTLRARLPETAIADVVIGGQGVEELFDAFVAHAVGSSRFEGWSKFNDGQAAIADVTGDRLTITSDATLPGGLGTHAFDDVGLLGARIPVIVDGVFQTRVCDQRLACWLGARATGSWGNTVVASGTHSAASLLVPTGQPTYHLLRFSQLGPHAATGAFSGEIRLGYLIDVDGTRTPIRGGSVSGNVFDAFARARLSSERTIAGRTHAPAAVRLDAVQITGG